MANGILDIDTYMMNVDPVNRNRSVPVSKALGLNDSYYTQGELYNVTPEINRPNFLTRTANDITSFVNRFKPSIKNITSKVGNTALQGIGATGGLNIGAGLGMAVNPVLGIPGALLGAFLGSKVNEMGPSGSFYEGLTDEQKKSVEEIYGTGGIMQGYNPISMFGRGAAGAIDKRRARIMKTLAKKDSAALEKRLEDLQKARDKITGTVRNSAGKITGGTGQGTIDSGNTGGYGGTGGEGPSAVSSSGMLGGGV